MEIIYSDEAIADRDYWIKSKNKKIQERITALIDSIEETPFLGIGKPEGLKYNLSGCCGFARAVSQNKPRTQTYLRCIRRFYRNTFYERALLER